MFSAKDYQAVLKNFGEVRIRDLDKELDEYSTLTPLDLNRQTYLNGQIQGIKWFLEMLELSNFLTEPTPKEIR